MCWYTSGFNSCGFKFQNKHLIACDLSQNRLNPWNNFNLSRLIINNKNGYNYFVFELNLQKYTIKIRCNGFLMKYHECNIPKKLINDMKNQPIKVGICLGVNHRETTAGSIGLGLVKY